MSWNPSAALTLTNIFIFYCIVKTIFLQSTNAFKVIWLRFLRRNSFSLMALCVLPTWFSSTENLTSMTRVVVLQFSIRCCTASVDPPLNQTHVAHVKQTLLAFFFYCGVLYCFQRNHQRPFCCPSVRVIPSHADRGFGFFKSNKTKHKKV